MDAAIRSRNTWLEENLAFHPETMIMQAYLAKIAMSVAGSYAALNHFHNDSKRAMVPIIPTTKQQLTESMLPLDELYRLPGPLV